MNNEFTLPAQWLEHPVRVTLIGVGGTGSEMLDILARMHQALQAMGHEHGLHVKAWDGDTVSPANIVRQRFYACDVGQNKAITAITRYNIFMGCDWEAVAEHITMESEFFWDTDLIISCVDSAAFRVELGELGRSLPTLPEPVLWLDVGNGAVSGQMVFGHLVQSLETTKGLQLPNVLDLFPEIRDVEEDDTPSCSAAQALTSQSFGVNKTAAVCATNLLWELFTKGKISDAGCYFNCQKNQMIPIRISETVWSSINPEWNLHMGDAA